MKVRIGVSAGAGAGELERLAELADHLERLGFDSLWLPEVLTTETVDPLVGLAWVGSHNPKLKLGTTMLLPGRHPVRLAKELASLDLLSSGRLLTTFVPGIAQGAERGAIGVPVADRGAFMDEVVPLLRRLWNGETVTHAGKFARFEGVSVRPRPLQQPLEAWGGGLARASLERCGRLFDGWLPALCTPEEAAEGRMIVERAAEVAGRQISSEHYGASVVYSRSEIEATAGQRLRQRLRGHALTDVVPVGLGGLRTMLERFIEVGFSKFVIRPMAPPADWGAELDELAGSVGGLQS